MQNKLQNMQAERPRETRKKDLDSFTLSDSIRTSSAWGKGFKVVAPKHVGRAASRNSKEGPRQLYFKRFHSYKLCLGEGLHEAERPPETRRKDLDSFNFKRLHSYKLCLGKGLPSTALTLSDSIRTSSEPSAEKACMLQCTESGLVFSLPGTSSCEQDVVT